MRNIKAAINTGYKPLCEWILVNQYYYKPILVNIKYLNTIFFKV